MRLFSQQWLCCCLPEGAVFTFIQAGEAAVQAGDLTVGDCGEENQDFTIRLSEDNTQLLLAW